MMTLNKTCFSPFIVCSFQRIISSTRHSINDVDSNKVTQHDKDTHKSKCVNEKHNKNDKHQDKQGSNVSKATKKMNENYD